MSRPVLRWFGGKWILAPWIISHFPKHRIYVEPFGGAASVLMRKEKSYAEVYNDLDDSVFTLFSVLKTIAGAAELQSLLERTPFSRREYELAHSYTPDPVEKSRRLIIRSFMGFGADSASDRYSNSGFRSNSNRSGTTPAHDWVNYSKELFAFHARLKGVVIENRDYEKLCREHDGEKALFYFDPPYVLASRERKRGYTHDFTDADQERFLGVAKSLVGAVLISGYDSEIYSDHLKGWQKAERVAYADGAAKRKEVLWMKPQGQGEGA